MATALTAGQVESAPAQSERCEWTPRGSPVPEAPDQLVAVVVDTSFSTQRSVGFDLDGDGMIGRDVFQTLMSTDPEDTVLDAELRAACVWLQRFFGSNTRAALISFAGSSTSAPRFLDPAQVDAVLRTPSGRDGAALAAGLRSIRVAGAAGASNHSAGLRLAREVLAAGSPGTTRRILLLTDGDPNLPQPPPSTTQDADVEAALIEGRRAKDEEIVIQTLVFGDRPTEIAGKLADITGGSSARVARSEDIEQALEAFEAGARHERK